MTSYSGMLFASASYTKEPEKLSEAQRLYDPGMINKCDQSMGPGHCTQMGMNVTTRPPAAPPVLICTALPS